MISAPVSNSLHSGMGRCFRSVLGSFGIRQRVGAWVDLPPWPSCYFFESKGRQLFKAPPCSQLATLVRRKPHAGKARWAFHPKAKNLPVRCRRAPPSGSAGVDGAPIERAGCKDPQWVSTGFSSESDGDTERSFFSRSGIYRSTCSGSGVGLRIDFMQAKRPGMQQRGGLLDKVWDRD